MSLLQSNQPQMVRENGIFLPRAVQNTRNTADSGCFFSPQMDSADQTCSMKPVVKALPLRALFASLFRYPSPIGRPISIPGWSSIFIVKPISYTVERQGAQNRLTALACFDGTGAEALAALGPCGASKRGETTCIQRSEPLWRSADLPGWRPVVTPHWNRPLSGQVRAPERPQCWTETCLPGRLSARRAMSSIAKPKRRNARSRLSCIRGGANAPQWGKTTANSRWHLPAAGVSCSQWGASNQRGADYGHYQSSTSFGCVRGVCSARGIEPYGVRSVSYDTDHKLIGRFGACLRADLADPIILTKRMYRESGACALSCSNDT